MAEGPPPNQNPGSATVYRYRCKDVCIPVKTPYIRTGGTGHTYEYSVQQGLIMSQMVGVAPIAITGLIVFLSTFGFLCVLGLLGYEPSNTTR